MILCFLFPFRVFADCDFSKGITAGPNKTFIYTESCHQKVGTVVADDAAKTIQVNDLNKAITLKDLALQDSDKSKQAWMKTSATLEDRLQKVDGLEKKNDILYFGLGVLTTFAAALAAAKLVGK